MASNPLSTSSTIFSYSQSQVPIFEGENYRYWSDRMMFFFISQDLWELIEEDCEEPPATGLNTAWTLENQTQYKKNIKKNALALRYLHQGVSKSIYPRTCGITKAKVAWETLKKEFQGNKRLFR